MRLYEIENYQRGIRATKRFKSEYFDEVQADPSIRSLLIDFLAFKQTARPDTQFNRKDAPFRYGDLKGFRHCHLRYGKRIVSYELDPTTIYLASLTDHSAYDGHNPKIAPYLKGLTPADYTPFSPEPASPTPPQDSPLLGEITGLCYELSASTERSAIEQLAQGDTDQFMVYAQLIPATGAEVANAFGTRDRMMAFAKDVLAKTAFSGKTARSTSTA